MIADIFNILLVVKRLDKRMGEFFWGSFPMNVANIVCWAILKLKY